MPSSAYVCDPVQAPAATVPGATGDPSPQLIVHVCVSCVPTSVKLALTVAEPPSTVGEFVVGVATTGATLLTVTEAVALSVPVSSSVTVTVIV